MADGWIELFDVETDEVELLFVFDRFEPVDYGCGVFPLVEVVFFRDCAVDAVEDDFADFAYLGLSGVDESAGRFVCQVRLVILKCYECVFVGCSVHSVVDSQFCHQYTHRTQIPRPSRQALSQRSQAKKNLQPKHHQDQLQLYEQHETNNR